MKIHRTKIFHGTKKYKKNIFSLCITDDFIITSSTDGEVNVWLQNNYSSLEGIKCNKMNKNDITNKNNNIVNCNNMNNNDIGNNNVIADKISHSNNKLNINDVNEKSFVLHQKLRDHHGAVMCVKSDKEYLATVGDDCYLCLYKLIYGQKNTKKYKLINKVKNHSNDIIDLCIYSEYLITAGMDGIVNIYSYKKFSLVESIDINKYTIKNNEEIGSDCKNDINNSYSRISGISVDPLEKYFIVQTESFLLIFDLEFKLYKKIEYKDNIKIFECFYSRMSWSPDSNYLATCLTFNNKENSVEILSVENEFKNEYSLIGHVAPIEVVRFHPNKFIRNKNNEIKDNDILNNDNKIDKSNDIETYYIIIAASQDKSISFWCSLNKKPFLLIKNLFELPVLDMQWKDNILYLASFDGNIVYIEFNKPGDNISIKNNELGCYTKITNSKETENIPFTKENIKMENKRITTIEEESDETIILDLSKVKVEKINKKDKESKNSIINLNDNELQRKKDTVFPQNNSLCINPKSLINEPQNKITEDKDKAIDNAIKDIVIDNAKDKDNIIDNVKDKDKIINNAKDNKIDKHLITNNTKNKNKNIITTNNTNNDNTKTKITDTKIKKKIKPILIEPYIEEEEYYTSNINFIYKDNNINNNIIIDTKSNINNNNTIERIIGIYKIEINNKDKCVIKIRRNNILFKRIELDRIHTLSISNHNITISNTNEYIMNNNTMVNNNINNHIINNNIINKITNNLYLVVTTVDKYTKLIIYDITTGILLYPYLIFNRVLLTDIMDNMLLILEEDNRFRVMDIKRNKIILKGRIPVVDAILNIKLCKIYFIVVIYKSGDIFFYNKKMKVWMMQNKDYSSLYNNIYNYNKYDNISDGNDNRCDKNDNRCDRNDNKGDKGIDDKSDGNDSNKGIIDKNIITNDNKNNNMNNTTIKDNITTNITTTINNNTITNKNNINTNNITDNSKIYLNNKNYTLLDLEYKYNVYSINGCIDGMIRIIHKVVRYSRSISNLTEADAYIIENMFLSVCDKGKKDEIMECMVNMNRNRNIQMFVSDLINTIRRNYYSK